MRAPCLFSVCLLIPVHAAAQSFAPQDWADALQLNELADTIPGATSTSDSLASTIVGYARPEAVVGRA